MSASRGPERSHLPAGERSNGRLGIGCAACDATFLGEPGQVCPVCAGATLQVRAVAFTGEPEVHLRPALDAGSAAQAVERASQQVPMRLSALAGPLPARLVWFPTWLVDAEMVAFWQAEVGFDYEVQSTREVLSGGRWVTEPHIDVRVRWEPRAGTLERVYHNASAPALADHELWDERLGPLLDGEGDPGGPDGLIRLPDRAPNDAWPDALAELRQLAAEDARVAASAQHVREAHVRPATDGLNWTWLLAPIWVLTYPDGAGVTRTLWVHARTGRVWGPMLASPTKGWVWASVWAVTGLSSLAASVVVGLIGVLLWPLLILALFGGAFGLLALCLAIVPPLRVRGHNAAELKRTGTA